MDHISDVIKNTKHTHNVTIVNVNTSNNDNSVVSNNKYALNRDKFTPNTPETKLAEEIATSFDDLQNYAFYLSVVKRLGHSGAYSFWQSILEEIEQKRGSRYEIRNHKRYFAWKFREGHV